MPQVNYQSQDPNPLWISNIGRLANALTSRGTTAGRSTKFLFVSRTYFDTILGKPIWYDGTNWIDATGATV